MDSEFLARAIKYWDSKKIEKVTGGKNLLMTPGNAPHLLRVMSLLNSDASMSANNVRKFRQINHMLALICDPLRNLANQYEKVRVIDIGCGNSYMTLLLAWYLKEYLKKTFECVGIDSNLKVIEASRLRAYELGFDDSLRFVHASVEELKWEELYWQVFPGEGSSAPHPNMVIGLHACDVASDLALAFGARNKADYLAIAPCCQAELAKAWKELVDTKIPFTPVFRSHHFRRELAADISDVMRMLLMRAHGYEVTATEFIGSEHTAKNRLLLCTRRGSKLSQALKQYYDLKLCLGNVGISLEERLALS